MKTEAERLGTRIDDDKTMMESLTNEAFDEIQKLIAAVCGGRIDTVTLTCTHWRPEDGGHVNMTITLSPIGGMPYRPGPVFASGRGLGGAISSMIGWLRYEAAKQMKALEQAVPR